MVAHSQKPATIQEECSILDQLAHETTHVGHSSLSGNVNQASSSASSIQISCNNNHGDSPGPRLGSQLIPVIYTEYHFDDLKFGALQYTKDMLEKHKKLGIMITRTDIERHWRMQVAREFSDDHPLRTILQKQLKGTTMQRFWKSRGAQYKDTLVTCIDRESQMSTEASLPNPMDVDEPVVVMTTPTSKVAGKRRRRQRNRNPRKKGGALVNIVNQQVDEAMEQAMDRVDITGTATQDIIDRLSAELNNELGAAPIEQTRNIPKARSNEPRLTASSLLQPTRLPRSSKPPSDVSSLPLRDEDDGIPAIMDWMDWR